jgi:uncharacterized repeat protein (TIGR01451 family)
LSLESLENRTLLAADLAAIAGTVFVDQTEDGLTPDDGTVDGVTVDLFRDGGDGIVSSDDVLVDSVVTDAAGNYRFDGLSEGLFFVQQTPIPGTLQRIEDQLRAVVVTADDASGTRGASIDSFDVTSQTVSVSSLLPATNNSSLLAVEAIGGERDILVELISGPGDVEMRVLHLDRPLLTFSADSGAVGRGVASWDGIDSDGNQVDPIGLNGFDLTEDGANLGIEFLQGADLSGGILTLTVYTDADNFSFHSQPIPQTPLGTADIVTVFWFDDFLIGAGTGADFANVGAIELEILGVPAMDAQVDEIGTIGPTVKTIHFANLNPMSLGDTVWFDANNNGLLDGDEQGIPGVALTLVEDTNGDGFFTPGVDLELATTVTDSDGIYGFGALFPGDYLVQIDAANFDPGEVLFGLVSSTAFDPVPDPNNNVDGDNNGYELSGHGIVSRTLTLSAGSEPTNAVDLDPNANLTLDFGLSALADLQVTKSDDPDPVTAGSTLMYTLVVTNHGPSPASNVVLTDPLPSGVTFLSLETSQGAAGHEDGVVTAELGDMALGDSATITIIVAVDASMTDGLLNEAQVTSDTLDPLLQNNVAEEPTDVQQQIDLRIAKADDPDPVIAGQSLTYTLVVHNDGPSDATGVTVVDNLPPDVQFVSAVSTLGTASHADGQVTVELGNMAVGQSETVTIAVTVAPSARDTLFNSATVTGNEPEIDTENNTASVVTTVQPLIDLAITKADDPSTVLAGQNLTYTLVVSNLGPSDATGVTVLDDLPSNVAFVSGDSTQGVTNFADGIITVDLGDMAVGQSETVTIVVTVAPTARNTLVNTATVSGNEPEDDTSNNSASVRTPVQPLIDLAITKADDPSTVLAGQNLTYTLVVSNLGPSDATGVTVVDQLPPGVQFVSAASTQGVASHADGTVTVNLGDLAADQSETVTMIVTVASSAVGTLVNTATVSGIEQERDTSNNSASVTTTIQSMVDLAIFKADSPDPVIAGQELTYILSVVNNGPSNATGVMVTDQLPDEVQFQSGSTSQGTLIQTNGMVSVELGDLAAGATATVNIVVHVDPSTRGTIINTANVTSNEPDSQTDNNTDSEPTLVQAQIDLAITKIGVPDSVAAGDQLTYTLNITNQGPSDATEVQVQDLLPPQVEFQSATSSSATVTHEDQVVTVNLGNLAVGDSQTITLVTRVTSHVAGEITNRATVSGAEPELNLANNMASWVTAVDAIMSSLAGYVYVDHNNNGGKNSSEEGIGDVTVRLLGITRDGSTIQRQQLTAADGSYHFNDLPPGVYHLTQDQPEGYLDGRDTPGTAPTDVVENNRFTGVRLEPGVDAVQFLFGEQLPVFSKRLFLGSFR